MSTLKLKLHKLPDTKPTKHTISVMPDLEADLEAYAKVYEQAYGEKANISALIPSCLLYTSPSPRDATLSRMPSSA